MASLFEFSSLMRFGKSYLGRGACGSVLEKRLEILSRFSFKEDSSRILHTSIAYVMMGSRFKIIIKNKYSQDSTSYNL